MHPVTLLPAMHMRGHSDFVRQAMEEALKVIGNEDIKHMTEMILTAITKPKEVPEIMYKMVAVTSCPEC